MSRSTVVLAVLSALALHGCKQDRPVDGTASRDLPLPHKLPPAPPAGAQPKPPHADHAAQIDKSYATVLAMYEAPEGATPCESAWNAVAAEQQAAKTTGTDSIFTFVAPHDVFVSLCGAMPAASQQCLIPRYRSRNQASCATVTPGDTAKLFVTRKNMDEPHEPEAAAPN